MKISTYIAMTKDGFIASKDGDISFLDNLKIEGDGGYSDYYSSIDALVYGINTYNKVKGFNLKTWPYEGKVSYVLTHSPDKVKEQEDIVFTSKDIKSLVKSLNHKHIWVMGGASVVNQFIELDLLDELHISVVDLELKEGIELFKLGKIPSKYKLIKETSYGDIVTMVYKR